MKEFFLLSVFLVVSSCAHTFMRGTVAKKVDSRTAIICLGENDIEINDTVKFQESVCSNSRGSDDSTMHELTQIGGYTEHTGYGTAECELVTLGYGKVVRLMNNHYSLVKTDSVFKFEESTQIERIR